MIRSTGAERAPDRRGGDGRRRGKVRGGGRRSGAEGLGPLGLRERSEGLGRGHCRRAAARRPRAPAVERPPEVEVRLRARFHFQCDSRNHRTLWRSRFHFQCNSRNLRKLWRSRFHFQCNSRNRRTLWRSRARLTRRGRCAARRRRRSAAQRVLGGCLSAVASAETAPVRHLSGGWAALPMGSAAD